MEVVEAGPPEACDLFFQRVGADISLFSPDSNQYTPARALAVSNRFGLTFFAHPEGFSVIRTSELIKLSQELEKYPKNAVHEKSLLKVTLPNIRILALSCDDLGLAVCAGSEVRLYDTAALVNEVNVVPAEVQSLGSKNFMKDFRWCPSDDGTYLALTSEGTCSVGRLGGQLEVISSNVLAVSWSADGKYIAYVQGFTLSLREKCSSLSFDIKLPNSFPHLDDCNLKVDSIQWLDVKRMLVCFAQENQDKEEFECPFFVLSSTAGPLADKNSEQKGVIFTELFRAVSSSVLPNASGPYMLASLFASWEIVIAVCRRSIDDYFVFLNWEQDASLEKIKELQLEIAEESGPQVAFPVNLDDNAITGMCIDQTVGLEVVVSNDGVVSKNLPSCPVFLFTTLEGNLSLFSFARLDKKWHSQHHVKPPSRIEEIERKPLKLSSKTFSDPAISTEAHSKAVVPSHNTVSHKPSFIGAEMHKGVSTGQNRAPVVPDQRAQAFPLGAKVIMPVGVETVRRNEKDRQFHVQALGTSDRDADFLLDLNEVRRVADEIDELMSTMDVKNGAPQGMLNKQSLESFEKKLSITLNDCKNFKSKLADIHHEIADLHDQSLQVDAWRIYVQSLFEQAADAKYQDMSFHRKLQPEMELKRKNVLRAEQILKERIAELENHFHVLELNQKRQHNDPLRKRASQSSLLGQPQSFQSLYSTVNTQLEVAGQLSSSLTQQMEALKISPSSSRNAYSRRETILKSLGIPADVVHESTSSSEIGSLGTLNASGHVLSTPKKTSLLEKPGISLHNSTTRRRRDSMDNAWARVGAAKTTIKRVSHTSSAENKNNGPRTEQKRLQLWGSDHLPEAGIKTHLSPISMELPASSRQDCMIGKPFMTSNTRQKLESNEGERKTPDSLKFISASEASVPTILGSNIPKKSDASIINRLVKEEMPKASPFQAVQQPSKMEFLKQEGSKSVNTTPKFELGPASRTQPMAIAPSVVSKSEPKTVPLATLPSTTYTGIQDGAVKMLSNNATSSPMLFPVAPITSSSRLNTLSLATASMVSSSSSSTMLSNSGSEVISSSFAAQAKLEHIAQRPLPDSPSKEVVPSAASIAAASSSSTTVTIGASNTMSSFKNVAPSIANATAASSSSPISVMASNILSSPAFHIQPKLDQFSQSPMAQTSGIFSSLSNSQVASSLNSGAGSPQAVAGLTVKPAIAPSVLPTPIESDEEDMDEELSSGGETFGTFGGLGLGGLVASSAQKPNPFGATFTSQPSSVFTLTQPTGQLFRPPSFSLTSAQSSATSQSSTSFFGAPSTAPNTVSLFGSPSTSSNTGGNLFGQPSLGAFGKPAQLGPGQQALGSALGAFGQTRQVGFGTPSAVGGGITSGGGFANAATGGGFANAATGFSSIASGGGFSAFSQKASNSAFASFAGSPGGFGGASPAFGGPSVGASGFGAQPSQDERFTQIRK